MTGLQKEQFKVSKTTLRRTRLILPKKPFHSTLEFYWLTVAPEDVKVKVLSGMKKFGNRDDEFFCWNLEEPVNDAILGASRF